MSKIGNTASLEWIIVRDYCEERIAELHEENEIPLDPVDTSLIRGKIEAFRDLLSLQYDDEGIEAHDPSYID